MKIIEFIAASNIISPGSEASPFIFPPSYYKKDNVRVILSNAGSDTDSSFIRDDTGDNIASYNKQLAEYTALYHVWKNFDLTGYDAVKFVSYRKPFAMATPQLAEALAHHDGIVVKIYQDRYKLAMLSTTVGPVFSRFEESYRRVYDNWDAFIRAENTGIFYPCTTFVLPVSTFTSLCEFIFPVLLDFVGNNDLPFKAAAALGEDLVSFFYSTNLVNPFFCPMKVYNYPNRCRVNNRPVLCGELTTGMQDYNLYYGSFTGSDWGRENSDYLCEPGMFRHVSLTDRDMNV